MINLLLPADQKAVRAEYRHRLFVVGGLLAFGLALVALIIVSSFALILSWRRNEVAGQIAGVKQQFSTAELVKTSKVVEQTNGSLKILASIPIHEPVADILQQLIDQRTSEIKLTDFKFTAEGSGLIEVQGKSQTRAALLAYLEALRTDSHFSGVESPVKNIIRERDVSFNLIITMSPLKK